MAGSHNAWRESIRSQQFLTLLPDTDGMFAAIEQQVRGWQVVIPIWRGAIVVNTLREEITGTGMRFRITDATADSATLTLTPYFHSARDGKRISVTELRTILRLKPGIPYVIAGEDSEHDTFARGFFSYGQKRATRQVAHIVNVEVGEAGP